MTNRTSRRRSSAGRRRYGARNRPPLSGFDRMALAVVRYARVGFLSRRQRESAAHTAVLTVLGTLAGLGAVVVGVAAGWVLFTSGPVEALALVVGYLVVLSVAASRILSLLDRTGRR